MTDTKKNLETMTVEECFDELESIVACLENEQTKLEESVKLFERGVLLSEKCNAVLTGYETRIRQVIEAANGTLKLENLDMTSNSNER